jgi:hypothetical protein
MLDRDWRLRGADMAKKKNENVKRLDGFIGIKEGWREGRTEAKRG